MGDRWGDRRRDETNWRDRERHRDREGARGREQRPRNRKDVLSSTVSRRSE